MATEKLVELRGSRQNLAQQVRPDPETIPIDLHDGTN
jgi:hypothetical protein